MSEPKKKDDEKKTAKTELPDTRHHYDPVGSLTNPKPAPKKEALKENATSQGDALGAAAQS